MEIKTQYYSLTLRNEFVDILEKISEEKNVDKEKILFGIIKDGLLSLDNSGSEASSGNCQVQELSMEKGLELEREAHERIKQQVSEMSEDEYPILSNDDLESLGTLKESEATALVP